MSSLESRNNLPALGCCRLLGRKSRPVLETYLNACRASAGKFKMDPDRPRQKIERNFVCHVHSSSMSSTSNSQLGGNLEGVSAPSSGSLVNSPCLLNWAQVNADNMRIWVFVRFSSNQLQHQHNFSSVLTIVYGPYASTCSRVEDSAP